MSEKYPKTRSPLGTYIVVKHKYGLHLATLKDWLDGMFVDGKILAVSLTRGPLKKWMRSYEHHEKVSR